MLDLLMPRNTVPELAASYIGRDKQTADLRQQYIATTEEYLCARRTYFQSHQDEAWPFVKHWLLSVDKQSPILDAGCGGGDDLAQYASLGFEILYGIDPIESMVRESRKLLAHRGHVQFGSWQDIPSPPNFFAALIGRYSLHYLRDMDSAFVEAHRVLGSGGLLIFVVSNPSFDAVSRCSLAVNGHACIRTTVYNRQFEITYYCHTWSEYFSRKFLDRFELVDLLEFNTAIDDQESTPSGLAIAARKR